MPRHRMAALPPPQGGLLTAEPPLLWAPDGITADANILSQLHMLTT